MSKRERVIEWIKACHDCPEEVLRCVAIDGDVFYKEYKPEIHELFRTADWSNVVLPEATDE